MTGTRTEQNQHKPEALIELALRVRNDSGRAGSAAGIRYGIVPATEAAAYPFVQSHLAGCRPGAAAGYRRAAAICVSARSAPQKGAGTWLPVGASIRILFNTENPGRSPESGDSVSRQIGILPMVPMEAASETFSLLIGRCALRSIPVDFYGLARTLALWGNGISSQSRGVRMDVVETFYSYTAPRPGGNESPTADTNTKGTPAQ